VAFVEAERVNARVLEVIVGKGYTSTVFRPRLLLDSWYASIFIIFVDKRLVVAETTPENKMIMDVEALSRWWRLWHVVVLLVQAAKPEGSWVLTRRRLLIPVSLPVLFDHLIIILVSTTHQIGIYVSIPLHLSRKL